MEFLKSILETAAKLEDKKFFESIEASIAANYDACVELIAEHDDNLSATDRHAIVECLMEDTIKTIIAGDTAPSLNESLSDQYTADIELLKTASDITLVGIHDIVKESFEQAVERILKSDRKLRMTSKDGKTKYKTRRRAAEAAAAASMAAVFGKKGVSRKAARGKRG